MNPVLGASGGRERSRGERGFTLLEITIILAVIAILGLILAPSETAPARIRTFRGLFLYKWHVESTSTLNWLPGPLVTTHSKLINQLPFL